MAKWGVPLTYTRFLELTPYVDSNSVFDLLANCPTWIDAAEQNFLGGVPSAPAKHYIQQFKKEANQELEFCNRQGADKFTPLMIKSRFDSLAVRILGAREQQLVRDFVFPSSILPHDNEYLTAGVAITVGLVDGNGRLTGSWHQTTTYSGNHAKANQTVYRTGGGSSPLALARNMPAESWTMIHARKPHYTPIAFLGDDRHAEDSWMAYQYGPFVAAVRGLPGLDRLPDLADSSLFVQAFTRPRIEVLMSMPPCVRAHGDNRSGCREYFRAMRADTHANIPILLYTYRPFEAAQAKSQIYWINQGGDLMSPGNFWAR